MYQMFAGQLPYFAKTTKDYARQHRMGKPIPPRELNPFISEELEEIINKVLSKEPSARYRTADQLGRVLLTFSSKPQNLEGEVVTDQQSGRVANAQPTRGGSEPITPQDLSQNQELGEKNSFQAIDWLAVGLGLIALVATSGLVPFWIWVYFSFNPPVR